MTGIWLVPPIAINHVSNALGTINPVRDITSIVRERSDAVIVCDGAQGVPHLAVGFDELGVDFCAFSGHKICGPMGIGGLIGKREMLDAMPPYQTGGDMIEFVYDESKTWNALPHKFEAGTPNAANAVGLAAACDYLDSLGSLRALSGVAKFPARVKCALLEWNALEEAHRNRE